MNPDTFFLLLIGYISIDWTKTGVIIESTPTDEIKIESIKSTPTDEIKIEPIVNTPIDVVKSEPIQSTATDGTKKEHVKNTPTNRKKNKPKNTPDKKFCDSRYNAAIILECSNACPFRTYDNTFGCPYCPFKSPDFLLVRNHSKDHPSKDFASFLRSRKTDIECKADVTDLRCVLCQTSMKDISTLFEHLIETHNKPLLRKYRIGVVPYLLCDGYACADCGLTFDWFRTLNKHVVSHYPRFICSECGLAFFGSSSLKYHLLGHSNQVREFKCSVCHESFPTLHRKRKHMLSEHNIAIYKCPYCTETFNRFNERVSHLNKVHDKNINYPCKFCPKVFTSTTSRSIHTRYVHIKDKPFSCEHCGHVFHRPDDLKQHMLKHTGAKKHQCQVCNKTFGRNRTLTEHMRIHNDDRRFACTYCNKAFVQKCSLKGHIKTHHPNA